MTDPALERRAAAASTPGGARPTTCPSADLPARQPAAARAAAARARQAAAARPLGHDARAELVYAHLNRAIRARDLDAIYVTGPGHGGPALVANAYLEGTYSEVYPRHRRATRTGMRAAVPPVLVPRRHPQPRRARDARARSTRAASSATRSSHAYGAAFDNPDLLVACVVGDGEAETGPLAASWHSNKFLDPARDGAVLPILHLNGYKIANPTVLARIPRRRAARAAARATATRRYFVDGRRPGDDAPAAWPRRSTRSLDEIARDPARAPATAASTDAAALADDRAAHAEGLDRPEGGRRPAGRGHVARRTRCRSPSVARRTPSTCAQLEEWMRCYRPEELFDDDGALRRRARRAARPTGDRRMSANPHANGGLLLRDLRAARLPRLRRRRSPRPATTLQRGDPRARRRSCAT